ncbi:nucleotidyltransferase domain-containing protein [Natranaerobius thermophilus]|uniref:DNA polymerase beta domain protein region n=1 Tax=Natranaerobius thermophilus (strain ATCC BAA-1301 / DSM 18059 / JW/NM-WN-LF) TaxID=457570 RepID=B2A1B5_NATTJ|nr:nucleotidyltransferase domain-containing protein [Natranaerobius thermophilus]ACB86053.1 DNA polymerase beta domain protein region [Natranaerobius thermophilus JW/NM-WN-LF]
MNIKKDIKKLCKSLKEHFSPEDIILFGSQAKKFNETSDIDLCIIINTDNKDKIENKMNLFIYSEDGLDFERSVDLVLYTSEEWKQNINDSASFANVIYHKGVSLYDKFNL